MTIPIEKAMGFQQEQTYRQPLKRRQLLEPLYVSFTPNENNDASISNRQAFQKQKNCLDQYKRQRKNLSHQKYENKQPDDYQFASKMSSNSTNPQTLKTRIVIADRLNSIFQKIFEDFSSQGRQMKIFGQVVENKNDIKRVERQKRFVHSQNSKYTIYNQPPMRSQAKKQIRFLTQNIYDPSELATKAKHFAQKVHKQQQILKGKCFIRRKKEAEMQKFKKKEEETEFNKLMEIKKEQRRHQVSDNILIMKQRVRICSFLQQNRFKKAEDSFRSDSNQNYQSHFDHPQGLKNKRKLLAKKLKYNMLNQPLRFKTQTNLDPHQKSSEGAQKSSQFQLYSSQLSAIEKMDQRSDTSPLEYDQGSEIIISKILNSSRNTQKRISNDTIPIESSQIKFKVQDPYEIKRFS